MTASAKLHAQSATVMLQLGDLINMFPKKQKTVEYLKVMTTKQKSNAFTIKIYNNSKHNLTILANQGIYKETTSNHIYLVNENNKDTAALSDC